VIEFEKSIIINRSPQDVFDFITDPSKHSLWQSSIESAEWTSDGPVGTGSTQKTQAKFLARKIEAEIQIMEWEPPKKVSLKSISGPIPLEITNKVETQENGTLLTTMGRAEFGGFFKLAEGLAGKQLEKQIETDLNSLKLLMESNQM
jgi:carbon monoxide dehydrogenase subunit G